MKSQSSYNSILRISAVLLTACAVIVAGAIALPKTGLLAKFVTGFSGTDSARVAVLDVDASSDLESQHISVEMYPSSNPYSIMIRAKNPGETAMRFTVSFAGTGNLPLLYTGNDPLIPSGEENTWTYDAAPGTGILNPVTLPVSVSWDPSEQGYEYSGGVEMITMTVSAVQID